MIKEYDRRKARRLMSEGEAARVQSLGLTPAFLAEREACDALVDRARRYAGDWATPICDMAAWSDETLQRLGVPRKTILEALEAESDLRELRQRVDAARAALEPKQRLGIRVREWLSRNHQSIA